MAVNYFQELQYLVFLVWLKFAFCLVIILFAGTKLARYGDAIAEKTGMGRIWIGLVLLAFITSMPELATGISCVALVKIPDLAMGTLLGSCLFNLLILVILDVVYRYASILSMASLSHIASAGIGILLIALAAGSILVGDRLSGLALGWVGVPSILIIILYLVGVRQMFRFERKQQLASPPVLSPQYKDSSTREVWFKFVLAGAVVIGAGIWLAFIGDEIAEVTGLGASFVGTLFLAFTTSVPELALTIAAIRLGAIDMALADVLGANMINIAKIFILDLFYVEGPILSQPRSVVSGAHLTTAVVAIAMTFIVIVALLFRQRRKTFIVISWYSLLLVCLYIYGAYAAYTSGIGVG